MIQYSQDYDEVCVSGSYYVSAVVGWPVQVYPYLKSYEVYKCPDETVTMSYASYGPYMNSYGMPDNADGGNFAWDSTRGNMLASGMAGWQDSKGINHAHNASDVQVPDKTLMLVESFAIGNTSNNPGYSSDDTFAPSTNFPCANNTSTNGGIAQDRFTNGIAAHSGGWNYGFVDGHVKWLRPEKTLGPTTWCQTTYGISADNHGMWSLDPND